MLDLVSPLLDKYSSYSLRVNHSAQLDRFFLQHSFLDYLYSSFANFVKYLVANESSKIPPIPLQNTLDDDNYNKCLILEADLDHIL